MKIGIFGASGYTGFELIQWCARHPKFQVAFATGETSAGQKLSDLYPTTNSLKLVSVAEANIDSIDLAFLCMPHGSQELYDIVKRLAQADKKIVDLGGDFRLQNTSEYKQWYGHDHRATELLPHFVYGLTELNRDKIRASKFVSNPGCYPTSAALGLFPFSRMKELLGKGTIVIDSKSGMSGAGRKAVVGSLFTEIAENIRPYGIGHSHRHYPEIRQTMTAFLGSAPEFVFTPQVIPVMRGILSNIYVPLSKDVSSDTLRSQFEEFYARERFVRVLPAGQQSQLSHVTKTNLCALSLEVHGSTAIITSCIDNLVKGASGQAIQNANLMMGLPEEMGLC